MLPELVIPRDLSYADRLLLLPKTVPVRYDGNRLATLPVLWDSGGVSTARTGALNLKGTVAGTNLPAELRIVVRE